MTTYLDILNRARARQSGGPISPAGILATTSDALHGVQAVNEAVFEIITNSTDLDFLQKMYAVNTTVGTNVITPPTGANAWNPQLVDTIQRFDNNNNLITVVQVPFEVAKNIEFTTSFSTDLPQFWYVNQGIVYLIPTPQAAYPLKIFYQGLTLDIVASTMSQTLVIPVDMQDAFITLTYAYLRRAAGDPEWINIEVLGKKKLDRALSRNKKNLKDKGWQRIVMATNWGDRHV